MSVTPPRPREPERISHRGARRELRENTIPAFVRAVERGAQAIELDVHGLADGTVVVHHDPTLGDQIADPAFRGRALRELRTADLARAAFTDGAVIPTLEAVYAALPPTVTVYVEVKAPHIEAAVAEVVKPHAARSAVHAFDHRIAKAIGALVPGLPTGILQASYLVDPVAALRAAGARDLWQYWEFVDAPLLDAVHAHDGRVIAWTLNAVSAMQHFAAWGLDGCCTDDLRLMDDAFRG